MKIYLVGGAVRDELLGLEVKERDWVVVGATVEEMLRQGYKQVGKDFPVFLHPETNEEFALARMERKTAPGYAGFQFDTSPDVTLEEDLLRRDLTINAMAVSSEGDLIDPYEGQGDLEHKVLRHVSPAFVEDPVRILRVARFAARFADLGFTVAPETIALMQDMVTSGEVDALVAERVWKELQRALTETDPVAFFDVLSECKALPVLFPLIKINGPGINALNQAAKLSSDPEVRFAALLYHLSVDEIKTLSDRYRVPTDYRDLAILASKHYEQYRAARELNAAELLGLLQSLDAFRREPRFRHFLLVCKAISRALTQEQSQANRLIKAYDAANSINIKEITQATQDGQQIAAQILQKRLEAIRSQLNCP